MGPFSTGIWPTHFVLDLPCSTWKYEVAPFGLGTWIFPFLVGDMDPYFAC